MNTYDFTTQAQVRKAFWQGMPSGIKKRGATQNDYPAWLRMEWCEFVDILQKNGHISDDLADKVTL